MAGPFGSLYAPTEDVAGEAAEQQAQLRRSQTPLQTVRLNLPTTVNPRAPISRALMEPKPSFGGVDPDSAVLASIIRATVGTGAVVPSTVGVTAPSTGRSESEDSTTDWMRRERNLSRPRPVGPISPPSRDQGPFSSGPDPRPATPMPVTFLPGDVPNDAGRAQPPAPTSGQPGGLLDPRTASLDALRQLIERNRAR